MLNKRRKIDPRIRYQHSDFTKKLKSARSYRRVAQPRSENRTMDFLRKAGLGSWKKQAIAAAVFLAAIYLAFIPNFLSVKTIKVNGLTGDLQRQVQDYNRSYLASAPFYQAQQNILFTNAPAAATYLKSRDTEVLKILSAKKHIFSRTLEITVAPKEKRYFVRRGIGSLIVYNDGSIESSSPVIPELPPGLIAVDINDPTDAAPGQKYFSDRLLAGLDAVLNEVPGQTKMHLDHLELNSLDQAGPDAGRAPWDIPDVAVYLQKNLPPVRGRVPTFKVFIDLGSDIGQAAARLNLLLSEMAPDRYKNLYYVDMRFVERGFICLVNTPCATESPVIPAPPPAPAPTAPVPAPTPAPENANTNTNGGTPNKSNKP